MRTFGVRTRGEPGPPVAVWADLRRSRLRSCTAAATSTSGVDPDPTLRSGTGVDREVPVAAYPPERVPISPQSSHARSRRTPVPPYEQEVPRSPPRSARRASTGPVTIGWRRAWQSPSPTTWACRSPRCGSPSPSWPASTGSACCSTWSSGRCCRCRRRTAAGSRGATWRSCCRTSGSPWGRRCWSGRCALPELLGGAGGWLVAIIAIGAAAIWHQSQPHRRWHWAATGVPWLGRSAGGHRPAVLLSSCVLSAVGSWWRLGIVGVVAVYSPVQGGLEASSLNGVPLRAVRTRRAWRW